MIRKRLTAIVKKWSWVFWLAGCVWVVIVDIETLPNTIATIRSSALSSFLAVTAVVLLVVALVLDYRKERRSENAKRPGS